MQVAPEQSDTLGRGLRCGFLGMLHMEVVQQRLREEHQVDVLVTAPTVPLVATHADGTREKVLSPASLSRATLDGHGGTTLEEPLVSNPNPSPSPNPNPNPSPNPNPNPGAPRVRHADLAR